MSDRPRIQIYEPPMVPLGRPSVPSPTAPSLMETSPQALPVEQRRRGRPPLEESGFLTWERRLTPKGVRAIKSRLMNDPHLFYAQVAREFHVSVQVVERLMNGRTWKHVK